MKTIKYNNKKTTPSKVVCIGRNYVDHIKELGNETPDSMIVFNKPNSAISNELKYFSPVTRFEGEICFLIENKKISALGFGLDLTHADIQNELKANKLPWERAKGFNGSAILGEFIPFDGDITQIRLELFINDTLTQFADYDLMMYKPKEMLEEIESFMSLEDGDVIMSGTPKGVGNYNLGDKFVGKVYEGDKLIVESTWIVT